MIRRNSDASSKRLHLQDQVVSVGTADLAGRIAVSQDTTRINCVQTPMHGEVNSWLIITDEDPSWLPSVEIVNYFSLTEVLCSRVNSRSSKASSDALNSLQRLNISRDLDRLAEPRGIKHILKGSVGRETAGDL